MSEIFLGGHEEDAKAPKEKMLNMVMERLAELSADPKLQNTGEPRMPVSAEFQHMAQVEAHVQEQLAPLKTQQQIIRQLTAARAALWNRSNTRDRADFTNPDLAALSRSESVAKMLDKNPHQLRELRENIDHERARYIAKWWELCQENDFIIPGQGEVGMYGMSTSLKGALGEPSELHQQSIDIFLPHVAGYIGKENSEAERLFFALQTGVEGEGVGTVLHKGNVVSKTPTQLRTDLDLGDPERRPQSFNPFYGYSKDVPIADYNRLAFIPHVSTSEGGGSFVEGYHVARVPN